MELVFATHNTNKLREVGLLLPRQYELLSLDSIGCTEEIPETGLTLQENARLKATYVFEKYGHDCFADDTGLIVDALNGDPGVFSARYAGEQKNSDDNMSKLLNQLSNIENRSAQFVTVIALKMAEELHFFKGVVDGTITYQIKGKGGFGYDPVFQPLGYDITFAEMPVELKNKISHRGMALRKLSEFLAKLS